MKSTNPELEAAHEAIRVLGGPSKAARLLNVRGHRYQTVQSWLRSRVPAEYCPAIEAETRARGAVVWCERLRRDVAWSFIRGHQPPGESERGLSHVGNVAPPGVHCPPQQTEGEKV